MKEFCPNDSIAVSNANEFNQLFYNKNRNQEEEDRLNFLAEELKAYSSYDIGYAYGGERKSFTNDISKRRKFKSFFNNKSRM